MGDHYPNYRQYRMKLLVFLYADTSYCSNGHDDYGRNWIDPHDRQSHRKCHPDSIIIPDIQETMNRDEAL